MTEQQPPEEFRSAVQGPGTWQRQEVAHGNFEAWHFFREGSQGAPTHVFMRPVEGGDPAAIARGITTTVLREVKPSMPKYRAELLAVGTVPPHEAKLIDLLTESTRPTDEYLAALAVQYERLTDMGVRSPVQQLAMITEKSLGTVKTHIQSARKKGFLEAIGSKAGGAATDKAHVLLGTATPIK
ncbi:hypothetical protein H9Y04_06590 [Streptomyces sp. TRM66268-LWL]|uniref:Uncharacterized protein n=1 Tax=Streptomyces polyasparticus TaxID=2767826 RepID=A0ABR7SBH9_9ACTN|nr:hypothetical protein [Streptomyces polyasparticus]MBC9712239.1 hypothetical protein [Streptomyces polyasparticus]